MQTCMDTAIVDLQLGTSAIMRHHKISTQPMYQSLSSRARLDVWGHIAYFVLGGRSNYDRYMSLYPIRMKMPLFGER